MFWGWGREEEGKGGTRAGQRRGLTGDGQVGGGLRLASRVAGKALEHAGVIRHQPADLQAPVASLPEAAQPSHLHHGRVLVPGDGGRRHTWGSSAYRQPPPRDAPAPEAAAASPQGWGGGDPGVFWFLETSQCMLAC